MLTMNLQLFGGRGGTGTARDNSKYELPSDKIRRISRGAKEEIKNFKVNRSRNTITITNSDGTTEKITRKISPNGDEGRKNSTYKEDKYGDTTTWTQDHIFTGKGGTNYLVTEKTTVRGTNSAFDGGYHVNSNIEVIRVKRIKNNS